VEQGARVLGRLEQQDVVVFLCDVVAERAVAWRHEVRVRVHEAGEDRCRAVVSPVHGCAGRNRNVDGAAQADDAASFDEHGRLVDGRRPGSVEQASRRDQGKARG
jgi:hypothetical protein